MHSYEQRVIKGAVLMNNNIVLADEDDDNTENTTDIWNWNKDEWKLNRLANRMMMTTAQDNR